MAELAEMALPDLPKSLVAPDIPDRSAVEIQYAAIYTEGMLRSAVGMAHTLQNSSSIPAVYTAELVECIFSVYCNYTSLYCISTALRSGMSRQELLDHWQGAHGVLKIL